MKLFSHDFPNPLSFRVEEYVYKGETVNKAEPYRPSVILVYIS